MPSKPPNVILLIFDSLRHDFLSCYDSDTYEIAKDIQTPGFDRLADHGTVFENAYAAGPATTISHAAMFSGKYPSETGVVLSGKSIPEDVPLLPSRLQQAGYDTFGLTGMAKLRSELGFSRGFDNYLETYRFFPDSILSPDYIRTAIERPRFRRPMANHFVEVLKNGGGRTSLRLAIMGEYIDKELTEPFFAFTNLGNVHRPWDPKRPFKRQVTPEVDRPRIYAMEYLFDVEESLDRDDVREERVFEALSNDGVARYLADEEWLSEAELDVLRRWYAGEVLNADYRLSQFLDHLERLDVLEETVLVVTSDHGDFLGEHGLLTHAQTLYDEVVHVPLIVSGPNVPEGERRTEVVSLVDLFDTICGRAGIEPPAETTGVDLFEGDRDGPVFSEHGIYSSLVENQRGKAAHLSHDQLVEFAQGRKTVRTDDYMFELTSNGNSTLYRRLEEEAGPVSDDEGIAEELYEAIEKTIGTDFEGRSDADVQADDPKVRRNLRDLGYID